MMRSKITWVIGVVCAGFVAIVSFQSCTVEAEQVFASAPGAGYLHKDLSEQMDAMAVYQNAIGYELDKGTFQNADWLVLGLDSVFMAVNQRLNNHPRLLKPFETYYEQKLKSPMSGLKEALKTNDTALARKNYILLVNRCNSCHNDHEVEEKAHY